MSTLISGERLNFIVAACAILISGASFYATFLQANSAEQQVKAMTWPLIEFSHSNYDTEDREKNLTMSRRNAGVGPAIVKSVSFVYEEQSLANLQEFITTCCRDEYNEYMQIEKQNQYEVDIWSLTTSPVEAIILPVGGKLNFLSLVDHPSNSSLWQAFNKERWGLQLEVCYCSLLESCYTTDKPGQVREVAACTLP